MTNSTDIIRLVENLRFLASKKDGGANVSRAPSSTLIEASDLIQSQQALIEEMREALDTAKATIKAWHGENAWEIYDRSSPEMVVINSALSKALSQKDQIDG